MTKTIRELRLFGFSFGGGVTLLGSLLLWKDKAAAPYVLSVAGVVLAAAALYPPLLRPLEKVMASIFRAVTVALTYVILTIVFLLVLTPIGLVRRLAGKDNLGLHPDPERRTYWVPVEPDGPHSRPGSPF